LSCLVGVVREFEQWGTRLSDAFTFTENSQILQSWGLSSPDQQTWQRWDIATLDTEACRAAAARAWEDGSWEYVKGVVALVGGVFATIALIVVAGLIIVASAMLANFLEAAAVGYEALVGVPLGFGLVFLWIKTACHAAELFGKIWAHEVIPTLGRAFDHGDHLFAQARELEAADDAAASLV
jgi:hypothetical protein